MPAYEFKSEETGKVRELWLTFTDLESMDGGWTEYDHETGELEHYRRVYNAPAVHFRGSGWACKS